MAQSPTSNIKASETTFEVLEALYELEGATNTEIAQHLDMNKSTVYNHLQTLLEIGYVVNGPHYDLGLRFLRLGEYARQNHEIVKTGRDEVDKLAENTGEIANLVAEEHGEGVFLYRAKGSEAVHMDTYIGKRVKLNTTAIGKCVLAHMDEERLQSFLADHALRSETPNTITDEDALRSELGEIRDQGFAYDDEERFEGLRCVASPIVVEEELLGAVSVSGPRDRLNGAWFEEEIPNLVMQTASVIEINLTFG